jgi:hypothetical protein
MRYCQSAAFILGVLLICFNAGVAAVYVVRAANRPFAVIVSAYSVYAAE